ncbi:hypothetical protein D3C87_1979980 [compost metagenome]
MFEAGSGRSLLKLDVVAAVGERARDRLQRKGCGRAGEDGDKGGCCNLIHGRCPEVISWYAIELLGSMS